MTSTTSPCRACWARWAGGVKTFERKDMQKSWMVVCATLFVSNIALAQNAVPVTVDNFKRAETDRYLALNAKEAGGLGKFHHSREPADIDKQTVIRMNRDTLYSFAVFDLDAGPVTITRPDAGKRFMSL